MSAPELGLIKEFLKLHKYVSELGNQFIISCNRLESIEKQLQEMSANFNESFAANRKEIIDIQSLRLLYYEFMGKFYSGEGVPFNPFRIPRSSKDTNPIKTTN